MLGKGAPELARLIPELQPYADTTAPLIFNDARATRFIMFDTVARFLGELCVEIPHVVAIDDLHRADGASVALLHHLARETESAGSGRLMLVAAYRDGDLRVTPMLNDQVAAIAACSHTYSEQLGGLAYSDVDTLIRVLSGRNPDESIVSDLQVKTSGNPFFLTQILRVLESEGRLQEFESAEHLAMRLPPHVQDAIRRQLRVLPEPVRELIEFASVGGIDISVGELESVMQLDRAMALQLIGIAVDAGVLVARTGEAGRYRFIHSVMRDAVYGGMPAEARAAYHSRFAHALEEQTSELPCAESAALAHHFANSASRADVARSIHFFEMAAAWSSASGAFEDAPSYLSRALALLDDLNPLARSHRCRLLILLGDAFSNAGDRSRARESLRTAASIASHYALGEELALAALRFAPDLLAIETGVYDSDLVQLLESAISAPDVTRAVCSRLLARLAIALQWDRDQDARSKALCAEAISLAVESGDLEAVRYARTGSAIVNFSLADPELNLAALPKADMANGSLGMLQRLVRITSLMLLGDMAMTDKEILKFVQSIDPSTQPQDRWYADLLLATRAQMEGRLEEAADLGARFVASGMRFGDQNALQSHFLQRMMQCLDTNGVEGLEDGMREMVATFPAMVGWRAGFALLLAELERVDEARIELRKVAASLRLNSPRPTEWYATIAALALANAVVREPGISEWLYGMLFAHADQFVVVGYSSYCLGSAHRLLGVLASEMMEWDKAKSHFESAVFRNEEVGSRGCNARIFLECATMLRAAGRCELSREWAETGSRLASEFGMARLGERFQAFLTYNVEPMQA
jgi:hypothetical protein